MIKINDLLIYLQLFELKALIIALLAYSLYFSRRDSFSVALFLSIALYFSHVGIQSGLSFIGNQPETTFLGVQFNPPMIEFLVFHPVYALTDFSFLYLVGFALNKLGYKETGASRYLVFMYLAHGFYQLVAFADFVVFETNFMDGIYSVIVPTLDGAMVFTVCFYVVTVISTDIVKRRREV